MNILILDAILFFAVGIPLALLWGKLAYKQKEKLKNEIRAEIKKEQAEKNS